MANANTVVVGMIGVGHFGAARRLLMRKTGLFRIAACYDHHSQRLAEACAEEGAEACADALSLVERPDIRAVVISTGATSHAELAIAAMRAGKHVFVEKPLCCSAAELRKIHDAQRATGCVTGVGHHQNESNPVVRLVRQSMADGRLGKVAAYEQNSSHSGGFQIGESDWRGIPELNPGGMLFQCGVHAIHGLTALFDPVTEVQASFRYDVLERTRTADVAAVTMRHRSGVVGTLNCYHVTGYCHELRVFGTHGNLYIDTFQMRAWYQKALYGPVEPREEVPVPIGEESDVANLLSWHAAILTGSAPNPGLAHATNALLPIFAAELAGRERRVVAVDEVLPEPPKLEATVRAPATRLVAPPLVART